MISNPLLFDFSLRLAPSQMGVAVASQSLYSPPLLIREYIVIKFSFYHTILDTTEIVKRKMKENKKWVGFGS